MKPLSNSGDRIGILKESASSIEHVMNESDRKKVRFAETQGTFTKSTRGVRSGSQEDFHYCLRGLQEVNQS